MRGDRQGNKEGDEVPEGEESEKKRRMRGGNIGKEK